MPVDQGFAVAAEEVPSNLQPSLKPVLLQQSILTEVRNKHPAVFWCLPRNAKTDVAEW